MHSADRTVELFRLVDTRLLPVSADAEGGLRSDVLDVRCVTRDDTLQLSWDGGSATL